MRTLCILAFVGLVLVAGLSAVTAQACVGARALGMGGAFTGLADDPSATYWNPAALPDLNEKAVTWMHTANNRERINYQDYAAYVSPVDSKGAFGFSYIKFQMLPSVNTTSFSGSWNQSWYWLSYGARASSKTSVGTNIKVIVDDLSMAVGGRALPVSASSDMAFDLALYHHATDAVTLGLLVQNFNEPKTTVEAAGIPVLEAKWGRNYRPGISVRGTSGVLFSAEVYDATDDGDMRALRVGAEKKFAKEKFALRAGRYAAGDISGLTLGAGTWGDKWSADVAFMGGDLDNTWLVSATAKY